MNDRKIETIDVHEFKKRRDNDPALCLIDVRERDEWQAVRIPGAILIPKDQIAMRIENQVPDRSQPIYLHCRGGVRSLHAAQTLFDLGYEALYSIQGGIAEWEACGYPVDKPSLGDES